MGNIPVREHQSQVLPTCKLNADWLLFSEEGNYLEGERRITFIVEKLQEIRKIYMGLKAEVACIDRRRKRAKRREKEGTAIALASLAGL